MRLGVIGWWIVVRCAKMHQFRTCRLGLPRSGADNFPPGMAYSSAYLADDMNTRRLIVSLAVSAVTLAALVAKSHAQAVPSERRIRHREQSLDAYEPFDAEEMWKRIPIPPAPALEVEKAIKTFEVVDGFRVECVASEPLVVDPVFFEFDPDGRLWVVEFRGWMRDIHGRGEADPVGRIVVLEDLDGDTFYEASTVFLDNLVMARTLALVQGGVLVAEPPHLWYCQDTNGDLACDRKRRVARYGAQGNPEHTANGLMHAMDNWMMSANCDRRHQFIDGRLIEQRVYQRGQWGMAQDDMGRLFFNYENRPLHCDLVASRYMFRNKNYPAAAARRDSRAAVLNVPIAKDDKEVFPIRVTPGVTLGANELREDGTLRTFTVACGPTIYRGDQFPSDWYGNAIIPEAGGNLLRRAVIHSDGVHMTARNAYQQRELLASTDERFRPVNSRTGPDGALYFCDLYRGVIEHVIYLMPYLRHQILSRGLDKPIGLGRIYRLVFEGKPLGQMPRMSNSDSAELVNHLTHPNGWWRDTAQRLLVERRDQSVVPDLRAMALGGSTHQGRVHALWTLEGMARLDWSTVESAIADNHPMVRATAVRLSEPFIDKHGAEVRRCLATVMDDPRPMVQLQLLLTLGEFRKAFAERAMARILTRHGDAVFRAAAISGLEGRELEMLERLLADAAWQSRDGQKGKTFSELAGAVFREQSPARVTRLLDVALAQTASRRWRSDAIVEGVLQTEVARRRWPVPLKLASRPALLAQWRQSSRADRRNYAARLHRVVTWPGDRLQRPQRPEYPPLTDQERRRLELGKSVYVVACSACHRSDGRGLPGQAPPLVDSSWINGPPERLVRIVLHGVTGPIRVHDVTWDLHMPGQAYNPLLNDKRLAAVLSYVRRAWDNYGTLVDTNLVAAVRAETSWRRQPWTEAELLDDDASRARLAARKDAPNDPDLLMARCRELLPQGDVDRGRRLFHTNKQVRCRACHVIDNSGGGFVGPDLSAVGKRSSAEELIESLVAPSARITKGFHTEVLMLSDGSIISGTVVSDDGTKIVISPPAGGTISVRADDIEQRIESDVSTMPPVAGLFEPEQIADLVKYLASLRGGRMD